MLCLQGGKFDQPDRLFNRCINKTISYLISPFWCRRYDFTKELSEAILKYVMMDFNISQIFGGS